MIYKIICSLLLVACINTKAKQSIEKKVGVIDSIKEIGILKLVDNTLKLAKTHRDKNSFIKDIHIINKVLVDNYIFILDKNFHIIAHKDPKLIGLDVKIIFDKKSRKSLAEIFTKVLKNKNKAWANYYWKRSDGKMKEKWSYLVRHKNYIIGSGYFK